MNPEAIGETVAYLTEQQDHAVQECTDGNYASAAGRLMILLSVAIARLEMCDPSYGLTKVDNV
jgi:hypothetical protein